ncbi:hypothetical protein [Duganella aceris]|uniref:Uncharacterized protein n=1 Tax=Duganella aceris TaxID=2703883 RepID=A0ABX0FUI6_9BURK|nr:hypothetical protein [Duganella aceris]NGZ88124.1 hypothetical protein [Duganella aceris]
MTPDPQFDNDNLARAENILLDDEIARQYFQGELYDRNGNRLTNMTLKRQNGTALNLDEKTIGRLFMIPDGSAVWALQVGENGDAPAGLAVQSNNPFIARDEQNSVIAFHEEIGPAMWIEALHVRRLMLEKKAPKHFGTIAFGLMAIAAYRLRFEYISLFAAGHGPLRSKNSDALVGFHVWPKFGFDAQITPVEFNRFPTKKLAGARTVQDTIAADPLWWPMHGSGRAMRFDLKAKSRSWSILLNYIYKALVEKS